MRATNFALIAILAYACSQHPAPVDEIGRVRAGLDETPDGKWELRDYGALSIDDHARVVYQASASRVLLMSSRANRGVWAWDGANWTRIADPVETLFMQGVAYDPTRDHIVVFGGLEADHVGAGNSNGTWLFDGAEWQTLDIRNGPSARGGAALIYDAARDRVLLTGGAEHTNGDPEDDTWLFDGAEWVDAMPSETPAAQFAGLAYDAAREMVVLVRPIDGTDSETWEWNGTTWTQVAAATPIPYAYRYSLTYDEGRSRVVGIAEGALWQWDGATWSPVGTDDGRNSERGNAAIAYDVARGRIVAHRSGRSTWEHDGETWHEIIASRPIARQEAAAVYDSARQRVVFFGGGSDESDATWEWDGANWTRGPTSGPPNLIGTHMAYDAGRQRAVVAIDDITWEYDGTAWTDRGPTPGNVTLMAYDAARAVVVGLVDRTETWTWDGSTWTDMMTSGPTGARDTAMAYDAARERIVRFGGYTDGSGSSQIDETWEWDGSSWTQVTPASSPSPRGGHSMAFDEKRGRIVLYGGYRNAEVWEYDGTTWTQRTIQRGPPGSFNNGMAYDVERDRIVYYASDGTLWEYYPVGETCETGEECPSGYCVDGVCCDRACTSSCEACSIATGAENDGICQLLPDAGTDCMSSESDGGITPGTDGAPGTRNDGGTTMTGRDRGGCCAVHGSQRAPNNRALALSIFLTAVIAVRRTRRFRRQRGQRRECRQP